MWEEIKKARRREREAAEKTASAHDSWEGVDVSVNVNDDRIEGLSSGEEEKQKQRQT